MGWVEMSNLFMQSAEGLRNCKSLCFLCDDNDKCSN